MTYLTSLYLPGALPIWCAMAFALASLWGYAQVIRGDESSREFARRAYKFFALSIVLSALVLLVLLLRRDFRIEYVWQYSGTDLDWHYQLAAFWAGQKGSFLIWLFWGALIGLPLIRSAGKDEAPVMGIYTLTQMGLLFILVRENPFVMLTQTPFEGQGLNPLLQDDWMVIHPPIMFIGYALTAVPFAFGMAALWRRDTSRWATRAFPWALTGFIVLGAAILMGGYWAYKTLGWGGYWGWDPVENASLIPWLLTITLVHGLYLERTRGRFRRMNLVISSLAYLSVLYGTFLTRSGVLADFSVHSFVDLGISGWLIALMGFFVTLSLLLFATRLREVPTAPNEDPLLSRGSFMLLAIVTLVISATIITVGTSAPLLTRFMENPGQVGPEFYNRVNLPLAILAAFLVSMVPFLTWKGQAGTSVLRRLMVPAVVAAGVAGVAVALGVTEVFHVLFVFLAVLASAANLSKVVELVRKGGLKVAGGYLAHVGVGVMLIGFISSSAYDQSNKLTLEQGVPQQVGEMTLTFQRYLQRTATEKERMEIEVTSEGRETYYAYPKFFLNDRTRQLMVNPDIDKRLLEDIYISPIEYDPGVPAGSARQVQLARDESVEFAGVRLRFVDFDMAADGNALVQMQSGGLVTIGAQLEIERGDKTEVITPLYRFESSGRVETPSYPIPGGGTVTIRALNAAAGAVALEVTGLGGAQGVPARLSIDLTRKPLIALVWYGLYVVLLGGLISTVNRLRENRRLDKAAARG